MAKYERGVYQPEDEIRVFDGSEDDEDAEGSRLPLLIVLALLVLAMFGGVVWLAYTQGVARGRTETPVLTAEAGPARVAPDTAGGSETPYKGFKIYEQPAPADDGADAKPAGAKPADMSSEPPVTDPALFPGPVSPPPAPRAEAASAAPPAAKPAPVVPAAAAKIPDAPPPMKQSVLPKAEVAKPPVAKTAAAKPVAVTKTPATPAATPKEIGPATGAPKQLGAALPAASAGPAPVSAGAAALQIGAYKSTEDATAAWNAYKSKHSALLAGYSQDVQRADLGDKGVWYRLRIAGFPSKDVAGAMCDRLKADGGGCFLAK